MIDSFFSEIFSIRPKRKERLDAHFMPASHLLSTFNKGFCLNGKAHLTTKNSHMSAMVLGGSGSGKSVSVAIPTIYNLSKHEHSIVIHDPSGELYLATAGVLYKRGYKIKLLHYNKPEISDGFNPLSRAKNTSDINKVAHLLIRSALGDNNKDPFWSNMATALLSLIIRILSKKSFWYQNLTNVKLVLDNMASIPESIDLLVAQCNDKEILTEHKHFLVIDRKLLTSVISTCRSALGLFTDHSVQTVTAYDSIDFESFRNEKTVLFINNKTGDMKYYAPLSSIFFEQFFSHLMESLPKKNDRSIFFILDEASSLYMQSTLQIALANLRKFRSGIMLIAQDFNQFVHFYGQHEAESVKTNCFSKVYFSGGQPLNTCNELEKLLGMYEFEDKEGNRRTRHLMTSDEIRTMETALILAGANQAIKTKMKPYFRSLKYSHLAKLPLPEFNKKTPFEELPLIPLPSPE